MIRIAGMSFFHQLLESLESDEETAASEPAAPSTMHTAGAAADTTAEAAASSGGAALPPSPQPITVAAATAAFGVVVVSWSSTSSSSSSLPSSSVLVLGLGVLTTYADGLLCSREKITREPCQQASLRRQQKRCIHSWCISGWQWCKKWEEGAAI